MIRGWALAAWLAVTGLGLTGCLGSPFQPVKPLAYDVRDVGIVAPATISRRTIAILDNEITDAIEATTRPVPMPRVVLLLTLHPPEAAQNDDVAFRRLRATVAATSVDSGADIAVGEFSVRGRGRTARQAEEDAALALVAQVRFAFGLVRPLPTRAPPRPISTRLLGWF